MNDADEQLLREVALFRYGLIADLIHLPPGTPGIGEKLRAKAEQQYTIPGTLRTRVAAETMRDWLLHYRRGGFDALYPRTRADRGRPRRLPPEVAELLISIKTEHPSWSVRKVIGGAIASGHLPDGVHLAHSTVHRLLRAEGLMSKSTAASDGTDRRRFLLPLCRPVVDERCHARSHRRRRQQAAQELSDQLPRRRHPACRRSVPSHSPRTPSLSCRCSSRR